MTDYKVELIWDQEYHVIVYRNGKLFGTYHTHDRADAIETMHHIIDNFNF